MSHIFDALQRSESELSGTEASSFSVATELLQAAEEKMRAAVAKDKDQAVVVASEPDPSNSSSDQDPFFPVDLQQCPRLSVAVPTNSRLVSIEKEESLGAEKFRFLAVRLRQIRQTRPLKKILITSTIPQEGKSTVAANLACTLARRKPQKTLLLEGDLRRPTLADRFGLGRVAGLSEWFHGEGSAMNIYRLDSLGLWVLPAGNAAENPLELMQSGKLGPLMDQLTEWFDWIVIDSPPVLPLADTSVWARMADGILLVTRPGVTEKQQLQRGLATLEKSKLLGALVNSSNDAAHSDYYQRYGPAASSSGSRNSDK
ncbi:MAG TPA: CpsD/CapB family tyrosine-protein kinase [Candidatus Sulfotelmatobacter sp.]|nr:CpsD/CapB family tyrosine-protein kinase [Candidatus Sulfotelmatobacter sp.]